MIMGLRRNVLSALKMTSCKCLVSFLLVCFGKMGYIELVLGVIVLHRPLYKFFPFVHDINSSLETCRIAFRGFKIAMVSSPYSFN